MRAALRRHGPFLLSLFAAVAVQKNVRDIALHDGDADAVERSTDY